MEKKAILTIKQFVEDYNAFSGSESDFLTESTISRILSGKSQAREETLLKIAKFVSNDRDATSEDFDRIFKDDNADDNILRIGTGFTSWSSYVLSLIGVNQNPSFKDRLSGIDFTFCKKRRADGGEEYFETFWVNSAAGLEEIRNNPDEFTHRFIANDLEEGLNKGELDGALLLRPTFESMEFSALKERPILLTRILVGHGTQMFVIERTNGDSAELNVNIEVNPKTILTTLDEFSNKIKSARVHILSIGNRTIQDVKSKLFQDEDMWNHLSNSSSEDLFYDFGDKSYTSMVSEIAERLMLKDDNLTSQGKGRIDKLILIAFAPINSLIFCEIQEAYKRVGRKFDLRYDNYPLSKMVDQRASYGLYVTKATLDNPVKINKLKDFLTALNDHVESTSKDRFQREVAQRLNLIYYPSNMCNDNISGRNKLFNDLQSLEYSNRSLDLIKYLSALVNRKL